MDEIIQFIQEMIDSIMKWILNSKKLYEVNEQKKLMSFISALFKELKTLVVVLVPSKIEIAYEKSMDQADKSLKDAGLTTLVTTSLKNKVHYEAVHAIVQDTLLDLLAAIRTAEMNMIEGISSVLDDIRGELKNGLLLSVANKTVTSRVAQAFLKNGLTAFITSDNKKLPLDYYSRLVTRTKLREAGTKGHSNRYLENGVGLVKIIERSDTCFVCAKYSGMVVSLTGEHDGFPTNIPLPPYHPHCRGNISPFVLEFKSDEVIEREKEKWRNWKEDEDRRTAAQKRAYEKSQEIRRKANEEKKQFMRWQSVLGAEMPKTLGAFRRMKRANSLRFQELQNMYLSALHSKD